MRRSKLLRHVGLRSVGLFLIIVVSNCSKVIDPQRYSTGNHEWFFESIPHYPYQASAEKHSRIMSGFPELQIGMTTQKVRELLGEPDGIGSTYSTETGRDELFAISFAYYLHRRERELAKPEDKAIFISFSPDEGLYHAYSSNVSELNELGAFRAEFSK